MCRTAVACAVLLLIALSLSSVSAEDITYRTHIRPLWEKQCSQCHGADAPYYGDFSEGKERFIADDIGPRMDSYADLIFFIGWPDTGAIMRRLDDGKATADRKPGNMYEHLGSDEAQRQQNLKLFKAWVGEDAWKLNRWNARGDVPAITKEELSKLKLKY